MATFSGNTFEERGQSGLYNPQAGAAGIVQARPYAQQNQGPKIDLGGTTPYVLSMPIRCDGTNLDRLRFDACNDGNLVYSGGTVYTILREVKDCFKIKDSNDLYFATLDFLIVPSGAVVQFPDLNVQFGGTPIQSDVLEVIASHGTEQSAGQATIVFPATQTATEGGSVRITMRAEGSQYPVFSGTITGINWQHFPTGVAYDCRDRMEYLSYPYGGTERVYTTYTGGSIQQNISEAQGIDSSNMSIEDDGATVGVIEPVVFRRGDTFLPWIRQNDNLSGYVTFTKKADSAIYRRPYDESVTGAGTHTLTKGVNLLSARRERSRDGIMNAVQVDGLTYLGATTSVYMATANTDIRTPPGTISGHVQSNLIETPARASAVGSVFLDHNNFKPESFVFTTPGTAIEPMDMVVVTHSDLGLSSRALVVTKVEDRYSSDGYITTIYAKRVTV